MSYADPTFANPCPDLTEDEYASLKSKIERQGFLPAYPVIKSAGPAREGDTVDGFHRLKVCAELGIDPIIVEVPFATEAEFLLEQIDSNLQRRQLTTDQRIRLVHARSEFARVVETAAEARRLANLKQNASDAESLESDARGRTDVALATMAGVGKDKFRKHVAVIESGEADLNEALASGAMSTDMAYRKLAERQALLDSQSEAEAEIAEYSFKVPPSTLASARERKVGELVRDLIALDKTIQTNAFIPDEVHDYAGRPHTFRGSVRRMVEFLQSLEDVL